MVERIEKENLCKIQKKNKTKQKPQMKIKIDKTKQKPSSNRLNYREALLNNVPIKEIIHKNMKKLSNLKNIQENDKFYFNENDEISIHKYSYYQGISRWYYSLNRDDLMNKLLQIISDYNDTLQCLKDELQVPLPFNARIHALEIASEVNTFNFNISNGLANLKKTYKDDKNICDKIDNIQRIICKIKLF